MLARRAGVSGLSTLLILIVIAIGFVASADHEIGPCAAVGGIGIAVILALMAPRKTAWHCAFCRKTYADLATMRPQSNSSGVSCLAWIIFLAAAFGLIRYLGMPWRLW